MTNKCTLILLCIIIYNTFNKHVSASNPAIFRVMFLIQEYNIVNCVTIAK